MLLFVMLLNKNVYRTPLNESLNQLMQMNRVNSRDEFGHEDNTINRLLLLLLLFWPRYSIPEEWKNYAKLQKSTKIKLEWTLLLPLLHKTVMQQDGIVPLNQNGESLNKKLISLSSPDWSASLRPSFERKTRPEALIGPNDSTATGWKIWWAYYYYYYFLSPPAQSRRQEN